MADDRSSVPALVFDMETPLCNAKSAALALAKLVENMGEVQRQHRQALTGLGVPLLEHDARRLAGGKHCRETPQPSVC
jgi:hypothetical protein